MPPIVLFILLMAYLMGVLAMLAVAVLSVVALLLLIGGVRWLYRVLWLGLDQ